MAEVPGDCSLGDDRVSVAVGGTEEVFAVADQNVPDDEGILDGFVFAVEEAAVEEVVAGAGESEHFADLVEFGEEPIGCGVVADSFAVAVPEFDGAVGKILDEATGVVKLELGEPLHFSQEASLVAGDSVGGSGRIDVN